MNQGNPPSPARFFKENGHWQDGALVFHFPGASDIPPRVINGLTNVKSLLRHKRGGKGKRGRPRNEALSANGSAPAARAVKVPSKLLEALEDELDKCLALVTGHDGLGSIAQVLKHARRLAIMKMST